jgi:hypothetical protein
MSGVTDGVISKRIKRSSENALFLIYDLLFTDDFHLREKFQDEFIALDNQQF